jgi:hypothetical protein
LQNNRIYSAASITDVTNMLKQYRLSGVLTIRRASDPYGEEAQIKVERGQPVQIRQGSYEEPVTNAILSRLLGWGMIYFTFHTIEPTLKLPPPHGSQPVQSPHIPHSPAPTTTAQPPASRPRLSPAVTRLLPAIPPPMVRDRAENYNTHPSGNNHAPGIPNTPFPGTHTDQNTPPDYSNNLLFHEPVPRFALEMATASLTPFGKNYPIAQIPRYDRVIYLLINGRRTIADLTQLTKRTVDEVCNSLYRLKQQELIVIRL